MVETADHRKWRQYVCAQVYKVPAGWPRSASDLSLPSIRMADNVRHVVGPVLAPDVAMDTPPVVPVAQGGPVYATFT